MQKGCAGCDELRKQHGIAIEQRNAAIDALQDLRAKYDLRDFSAKRYVDLQVQNMELHEEVRAMKKEMDMLTKTIKEMTRDKIKAEMNL